MANPVVLITSATSRNGRHAAQLLLAQSKFTVRLAARDPSKLHDLQAKGAETIALDPVSLESMKQVCTGVDLVYVILPSLVEEEVSMFLNFLFVAMASQIQHIVYLSAVDAVPRNYEKFCPIHHHYDHEELLLRSKIPYTFLRPAWFHENQLVIHSASIKHSGHFQTASGDGVWTSVAIADIAAVAVAVLNNPEQHAGKTYTLTTEAVTDQMVAEKIGKATGQAVRHVNLAPEDYYDLMLKVFGGNKERAGALVTLEYEKRSSSFSKVHPDLEQVLGRKGVTLDEFLAEHAATFVQPKTA